MPRPAILALAFALGATSAACSILIGVKDLTPAAADQTQDGASADVSTSSPESGIEAGAVPSAPVFVGSRSIVLDSSSVVGAPGGVKVDDLLLAVWHDVTTCTDGAPAGWKPLGTATVGDALGTDTIWTGYHVLGPDETEQTTWEFTSCGGAPGTVVLVAFRGARSVQPITSVGIQDHQLATCTSDTGGFDALSVQALAPSVPVFALALRQVATIPEIAGLVRSEMTNGLALFRAPTAVTEVKTIPGVHWDIPGRCKESYFSGSYVVVGASAP